MGSNVVSRNGVRRVVVPDTELELAPVGIGCVNAGTKWTEQESDYLFDTYYDMGGNVYDTARVYSDWIPPERGRSERVLGDWLAASGKRNKVLVVTKGGHPDILPTAEGLPPDMHRSRITAENMRQDLELSLKTLRTDHVDLYLYHRDNEALEVEELLDIMEQFVKEGKIRYYGCSNWSTDRMRQAEEISRKKGIRGFAANQALYNAGEPYMKQPYDDTLKRADQAMRDYHREDRHNLLMPYTSICGGFFHKYLEKGREAVATSEYCTEQNLKMAERLKSITEKYRVTLTQALMGFFACQDFVCVPLYSPRNAASMKEAMEAFEVAFERIDYEVEP